MSDKVFGNSKYDGAQIWMTAAAPYYSIQCKNINGKVQEKNIDGKTNADGTPAKTETAREHFCRGSDGKPSNAKTGNKVYFGMKNQRNAVSVAFLRAIGSSTRVSRLFTYDISEVEGLTLYGPDRAGAQQKYAFGRCGRAPNDRKCPPQDSGLIPGGADPAPSAAPVAEKSRSGEARLAYCMTRERRNTKLVFHPSKLTSCPDVEP